MPLPLGCGQLARTLIIVVALTAHLFFGVALCLGSAPLVGRQTPFPNESTYSGECV